MDTQSIRKLAPRLVGDAVMTFGSVWLDEIPETDPFLAQLKAGNSVAKGLRAAILVWSDGSFAKVSGPYALRITLDSECVEIAYAIGRAAHERRYFEEVVL